MDKQTTIIEVNGVKLEVDLRSARRIDELKIGSRVKCLLKPSYGEMKTLPGIIVGFEPFPSLPSIVVAYLDVGYGSPGLKFRTFNSETKDFEVIADLDHNALEIDRDEAVAHFDREVLKKEAELREVREKREFFMAHFGRYFTAADARPVVAPTPELVAEEDDGPF
jgi:hypothetical protein